MHGTFDVCASRVVPSLEERIRFSEQYFLDLFDPELGYIGPQFVASVQACGFREVEAPVAQKCDNVYIPFTWGDGFYNTISYRMNAGAHAPFFHSRTHEILHGLARNAVPALHASIYNRHSPVILCPRDWVASFEVTEADVAAKTAWIASLMAQYDPSMYEATARLPVSAAGFEIIRRDAASLGDALAIAARHAMREIHLADKNGQMVHSYAAHYQSLALTYYETMLDFYAKSGHDRAVNVRLSDAHLCDMGRSFGPNPFDYRPYELTPLRAQDHDRLMRLNERLGITDETCLPVLETALQWHGHTPQSFLDASKFAGRRAGVPEAAINTLRVA